MREILPDVFPPGLLAVFCGTAAGNLSAARGAYYANPRNRFWRVLHDTGIVPVLLLPSQFRLLPQWGVGLTDIAKHACGMDRSLPAGAFDPAALHAKLASATPTLITFNGKTAALAALGKRVKRLAYGPLSLPGGAPPAFVLPSTSGAANGSWDDGPWRDLAAEIAKLRAGRALT
jgi:TDG/mug DNA glycosylase family protein